MERLTVFDGEFWLHKNFPPIAEDTIDEFVDCVKELAARLASIEDILGDNYDLDRLRELVEADRDGLCDIHKVKDGEMVYSIFAYVNGLSPKRSNGKPFNTIAKYKVDDFSRDIVDREFGKTVFRTREAAEAALKSAEETGVTNDAPDPDLSIVGRNQSWIMDRFLKEE